MLEREGESGWSALYFKGSTHGSPLTLGGMICGWPSVAYPTQASEEAQILDSVRAAVAEKRASASPVAAIVIEPTQYGTGFVVSDGFINSLKSIADEFEAALVVDETNTGCGASGKGFWQYQGAADYVAFGKRMQATGYFSQDQGLKLGGSENDVKLFKLINQGMGEDQLVTQAGEIGDKLSKDVAGLKTLRGVTGARTSGTSLWVDTDTVETAVSLVQHLKSCGVLVKLNGSKGIVARPALVFGAPQSNELVNSLLLFK